MIVYFRGNMAGGWTGFSDEDLRRLKSQESDESRPQRKGPKNASIQYKPAQFQQRNKPSIERRMPPSAASGSASLQENLSRPKPTSRPIPNQSFNKIPRDGSQFTTSVALSDPAGTGSTGFEQREENKVVVKEEPQFEDLGPEEALSRDLGTLEKFREQQKQIEEANKQKKALLAKTLSERQKKARKEAEKLTHIQKELMILDNLLSADVTVIRNRIESASRDYLEATRRYERAEKEFIESKLDLQKKSEIKEELTEHLYTIIHQNEIRKARKLSDLMSELDMETKGEQICIGKLPPLSAFSSVNTVKKLTSPTSPTSPSSLVSQTEKSSTESPSKLLVSPSTDNGGNTSATVDKCSENGQGTDIDLPSTVLDFSNENPATNTSFVEIKNASSSDTISGTLLPSDSVEKIPNYVQEILDISAGSDATVIESVEKQSLSSGTDDASSYNNALSSNPEGDDSSRSPKHRTNSPEAEIQPISMPSTWTLDSVDIKKEPDT